MKIVTLQGDSNTGKTTILKKVIEKLCVQKSENHIYRKKRTKNRSERFLMCTSLTTIKYGGTKQQWEALSSSLLGLSTVKTVECFDGTIIYRQEETTNE